MTLRELNVTRHQFALLLLLLLPLLPLQFLEHMISICSYFVATLSTEETSSVQSPVQEQYNLFFFLFLS